MAQTGPPEKAQKTIDDFEEVRLALENDHERSREIHNDVYYSYTPIHLMARLHELNTKELRIFLTKPVVEAWVDKTAGVEFGDHLRMRVGALEGEAFELHRHASDMARACKPFFQTAERHEAFGPNWSRSRWWGDRGPSGDRPSS